ncbi:MAG: hypothetical protein US15_C0056G0006 [Candidatus Moranbacteria bacterium GW2011_GWF1_36_4]|nr:MAG: hypothetical protein US15_C0056G0006 [Candidatus Moranbacteria bacterium GW2011_GWF1_36_4]HAQ02995.1 hypothetical protein [Candidatus Nomurabacteria bacterium]
MSEKEIMHVGVLGMRWGRRNGSTPNLSRRDLQKKAYEAKRYTKIKTTKAIKRMSTKELNKYLNSPLMNEKMANVKRNKAAITAGKIVTVGILAGPFVYRKIKEFAPLIKIAMENAANAKVAANIAGKVIYDSHFI